MDRLRGHICKTPPKKKLLDINSSIREMIEFTRGVVIKSGVIVQVLRADNLPKIEHLSTEFFFHSLAWN